MSEYEQLRGADGLFWGVTETRNEATASLVGLDQAWVIPTVA